MAQSPLKVTELTQPNPYISNWEALSTLISRGRSFSGRERHCAFLNTAGNGFANMSASTGLDLIDDGRGLAVTDWDGDGDLDLWMTQRNGPRIRFVRNDLASSNHFLSCTLIGDSCNRDAIGARVKVVTTKERTQIRTVRAGDSFLSQSSKTLHFGLLPGEEILSLQVTWPGQHLPEFIELRETGHHYRITQGTGMAGLHDRTPPSAELTPSSPSPSISDDNLRLVIIRRSQAPVFTYVSAQGELETFQTGRSKGPTLINLWASWCAPCTHELANFKEAHDALAAKSLRVLALNTDSVGGSEGSTPNLTAAKAQVAQSDYPFDIGYADASGVQALTLALHQKLGAHRPLPLPCSFLIDRNGKVGVIYQGPVTVDQLLEDCDLLVASPKVIESESFPFPGLNGIELFPLTPLAFSQAYQSSGYIDDARSAIQVSADAGIIKDVYFLGTLEQSQSNWPAAVQAYQRVLDLAPAQSAIHVPLAVALWQSGDQKLAKVHFEMAKSFASKRPSIWTDLGKAYLQIDQAPQALTYFYQALKQAPENIQHQGHVARAMIAANKAKQGLTLYESIIKKHPNAHQIRNTLAWIYATHPHVHNSTRALELIEPLGTLTKHSDPRVLDTLAAAHAFNRDFKQAVSYASKARRLARATGETKLVKQLTERLAKYQMNEPWQSR